MVDDLSPFTDVFADFNDQPPLQPRSAREKTQDPCRGLTTLRLPFLYIDVDQPYTGEDGGNLSDGIRLSVTVDSVGRGTFTGSGIACPGDCTEDLARVLAFSSR